MDTTLLLAVEVALLAIFHTSWGIGTCNLHDVTPLRVLATVTYAILIVWGLSVGNMVAFNSRKAQDQLANPSLGRRYPGFIFIVHFFICVLHSLVLGPYFLINGLRKWYWSSFVAMLFASLPIVPFNYNPESFGSAVGNFVRFRNIFELLLSLYLATTLGDDDESFRTLSVYHYWIWGYRLLDVGPRRFMKNILLPSSLMLAVLIIIYVVALTVLHKDLILFAGAPHCGSFVEESSWMMAGRILYCVAIYLIFYILQNNYVEEVAATDGFDIHPPPNGGTHDENVEKAKKTD